MKKKYFGATICIIVILLLASIPTNAILVVSDNLRNSSSSNNLQKIIKNKQQFTIEKAFEYTKNKIFPLDGITGISYDENPPEINIYIESEEFRGIIPEKIKGFDTDVRVSGLFYSYGIPLEDVEAYSDQVSLALDWTFENLTDDYIAQAKARDIEENTVYDTMKLTEEQLNLVYDTVEELKERRGILYYILSKKALRDATTLTDDGATINMVKLNYEMQNYEKLLAKLQLPFSFDRTSRIRPIAGGISISMPWWLFFGFTAGTLGICDNGWGITCAHVASMNRFGMRYGNAGVPIIQPGSYDGGNAPDDTIGQNWESLIIWYNLPNVADAAIIDLSWADYLEEEVFYNDGTTYHVNMPEFQNPEEGMDVRLSGRTSGVSLGSIWDDNARVKVLYSFIPPRIATFVDVALIKPYNFGQGGDSGSVVDYHGTWVGLLFAGGSEYSIVCKAYWVTAYLWDYP